jgi:hypothetical protein
MALPLLHRCCTRIAVAHGRRASVRASLCRPSKIEPQPSWPAEMSSVAPHYAPVQPPSPADIDGAELDHSLSEFAAESESDGPKRTKLLRSTSTDEVAEVLACDSDAVPSVFYSEQRWIGALLSTANGGSSVMCYILQAACVGQCIFAWLVWAPDFAEAGACPVSTPCSSPKPLWKVARG